MKWYENIETEKQMLALGEKIGGQLSPGNHLVLTGDLGAGKTTLTKGIASGIGIKQMVKSPTYTIVREYDGGKFPLYHMDVYRLEGDLGELDLDEYYESAGICIIEWGMLFPEEMPSEYVEIQIKNQDDGTRKLTFIVHAAKKPSWLETMVEKENQEGVKKE